MKSVASTFLFGLMLATTCFGAQEESKLLYKYLPDVPIELSDGSRTTLLRFCGGSPTILTFAYSRCEGICYPFLYSLKDNLPAMKEGQRQYRTLVLSFDTSDTRQNMVEMAARVEVQNNSSWSFGTVDRRFLRQLTAEVGFEFRVDSLTGQIDHPPILVGVNDQGKIVRIVKSANVTSGLLWKVYRDIAGEFVPFYRSSDSALVSCFTYDPSKGKANVSWGFVILYLPVALGAGIVWSIFRPSRRARQVEG